MGVRDSEDLASLLIPISTPVLCYWLRLFTHLSLIRTLKETPSETSFYLHIGPGLPYLDIRRSRFSFAFRNRLASLLDSYTFEALSNET